MTLHLRRFALLFGMGCLSCGDNVGTSVGNPPKATAALQLVAYSAVNSPSAKIRPRSPAPLAEKGYTIEGAFIVVDRIRLREAKNCEGSGEIRIEGPLVADLLAGSILPTAPHLGDTSGEFCRFELRVKQHSPSQDLPTGTDPELKGLSMLIKGRRGDGTRFRIDGEWMDDLRLRAARGGAFSIQSTSATVFVAFALSEWIDENALNALPQEDPIVISKTRHKELYMSLRESVRRSARLFQDLDGNGHLNETERDEGHVLAREGE